MFSGCIVASFSCSRCACRAARIVIAVIKKSPRKLSLSRQPVPRTRARSQKSHNSSDIPFSDKLLGWAVTLPGKTEVSGLFLTMLLEGCPETQDKKSLCCLRTAHCVVLSLRDHRRQGLSSGDSHIHLTLKQRVLLLLLGLALR